MSDNEFEVIEARPEPSAKRLKKTHDSLTNLPHFEPTKKLEGLPNEILLKVFDNFQINDLISCSQVNRRIRSIAQDETLWQKVNLDCKRDQYLNYKSGPHGYRISAGLIQLILENGCRHLGISGIIEHDLMPNKTLQLNHLVISNVSPNKTVDVLLASCYSLEKLSLNCVHLSKSIVSSICNKNGKTLKVLNLRACETGEEQFDFEVLSQIIQPIIDNCKGLTELNLPNEILMKVLPWLRKESIDYVVNNLTDNILKLNLNGIKIEDDQLKVLVARCNKITELNLNGSNVSNESVEHLLTYLHSTLGTIHILRQQIFGPFLTHQYVSQN